MKMFIIQKKSQSRPNHFSTQSRGLGILALFSSVFMFACGDSGTSEATVEKGGMDVVASVADLPKCSEDNAGEQCLVKDEGEFYACNGKNWKILGGSNGGSASGEDVVSLEKLNGVSQKGPFINGSTVTLFELDGSRSLVQTGRTFGGEIITDDGRFSVNNVSLKSSYVRLTANGFYRNEVTGKNSSSSIVLNAYSDLQARNSVNINLLTHLEYYRVGYLMENGLESTIKASKKRAQKEIFAAFGIDNEGFGYSEDLDVFGEGDQNAALLAMSILLQGNRSEADLSALLANFGKDVEEDGTWDDVETRGSIAKWALQMIAQDSLSVFRENVEKWKLGEVPSFEKYIGTFVGKELGINPFAKCENEAIFKWSYEYSYKYENDFGGEYWGKDWMNWVYACENSKWNAKTEEKYIADSLRNAALNDLGLKGNYSLYPAIESLQKIVAHDTSYWTSNGMRWKEVHTGFGNEIHHWYTFSNSRNPNFDYDTEHIGAIFTIGAMPNIYYGFGFDFVSEAQRSGADVSKYKRINLAYSSSNLPLEVVLVPEQNASLIGDDLYGITQGDNFRVTLPATGGKIKEVVLSFADFAQKGWGVKQNVDDVVKALGAIQFAVNGFTIDFDAVASTSTEIKIFGVGLE